MKVTLVGNGRFWHFHLARQLERHGILKEIITGYPRVKLKDENGIPPEKIVCFPWIAAPYKLALGMGLSRFPSLKNRWALIAKRAIDRFACTRADDVDVMIGLSGSATRAGRLVQKKGGKFVCDRGSSHIRIQDSILRDEYERWGLPYRPISQGAMARELDEYAYADCIAVPSDFVYQTFIREGLRSNRLAKIPYGARLERFTKVGNPGEDCFTVLWVGSASIRKGFLDAIEAFQNLKHSRKRFRVVGSVEALVQERLTQYDTSHVVFEGIIPNAKLPEVYSTAHVFVLPSLEEGLALVQGEALACGCPVIASENTGGRDLFTDGVEGFEVPVRAPERITEKLQLLADNPDVRSQMSDAARERVKTIGGWDAYGDQMVEMLRDLYGE